MIRVTVAGIAGRMGNILARLVVSTTDIELVGATEATGHALIGENVSDLIGRRGLGVRVTDKVDDALLEADVLLDFTSPKATMSALEVCVKNRVAAVIGTTGFDPAQEKRIEKCAETIPLVYAPNMSLGVNLLARLVTQAAKALGADYDIEMFEVHHRHKADSPSGTALMLAHTIAEARGLDLEKSLVWGRKGKTGSRPGDQIGVMSLRAGDVVGEHTIMFAGPGERLELVHRAHSRETFAQGALRAVRWVVGKKPGLYSMIDVLGLND